MKRPRIPDFDKEKTFDWEYVFELNRYIDYQERQINISILKKIVYDKNATFCGSIDKCSSKHNEYYCKAKRNCTHKL
jgi:hypothetical protein